MTWADAAYFAATITTIGGASVLLYRLFLKRPMGEAREFFQWWKGFQRDWDGEPSSPGRDAVPGVMERLNRIDGEFQRNGGASLKDKVIQIGEQLQVFDERVDTMETSIGEIQRALAPAKSTRKVAAR